MIYDTDEYENELRMELEAVMPPTHLPRHTWLSTRADVRRPNPPQIQLEDEAGLFVDDPPTQDDAGLIVDDSPTKDIAGVFVDDSGEIYETQDLDKL